MTTKKLIKELMAMGASRNAARRVSRIARKYGVTNEDAWYGCCVILLKRIEAELGIAAEEVDDGQFQL